MADIPANFCEGKPSGTYPHPNDPAAYVQCSDEGLAYEHKCPDGQVFNPDTLTCDWE
ncbi:carbohydrate-binding module family 14 protein [Nocardia transvalensis]|uniref:carbohydrate-binding module family 14 protein n=1 Tax=Nocardia transvalensis TaxID=37333 RepID=UPI001893B1ED|nr:hypothetical protein [Nocardia transvalensis]